MFLKKGSYIIFLVFIFALSGCIGRVTYTERDIDKDKYLTAYNITEIIFEQSSTTLLQSIYSQEGFEKEVVGHHSLFIYGKNQLDNYYILIITDAVEDDIYISESPFPDYDLVIDQIELFNNNSVSLEMIIQSDDGTQTYFSNDIYNYDKADYDKADYISKWLFGDANQYEGDAQSTMDAKVLELEEMLAYGLIMHMGRDKLVFWHVLGKLILRNNLSV